MSSRTSLKAIKAQICYFLDDPAPQPPKEENGHEQINMDAVRYYPRGILLLRNGKVEQAGPADELEIPAEAEVIDYGDRLVIPGFIDTHVHYPQTEMIASYGEQLLDWLQTYTFPVEAKFGDIDYARETARFFLRQLLHHGTTTAMVFCTVHPESVSALFEEALERRMRIIAGKVLMDREAPEELLEPADEGIEHSRRLIRQWHDRERLGYAITPRFAITSSPGQLRSIRELMLEFPDAYMQTHVAESMSEVQRVHQLYFKDPGSELYGFDDPEKEQYSLRHGSYLGIYDYFGLLRRRSVLAHGVQLSDMDFSTIASRHTGIACCPTSNLFLGSGSFNMDQSRKHGVCVGLGTDVGAGTSFSMLHTLNEAYKTTQLRGQKLHPLRAFYLATLGGARTLDLDDKIGSFEAGREADFVVIDPKVQEELRYRLNHGNSEAPQTIEQLSDQLFALMMLGDDRNIEATYVLGERMG